MAYLLVRDAENLLYVCQSPAPAFDGSPTGFCILTLEGQELALFDSGIAGRAYRKTRAAHARRYLEIPARIKARWPSI